MSSVSFKKLHGKSEVVCMIRHCDKDERKSRKHSNKDIRTEHTDSNLQNVDFRDAVRRYEERIQWLDSSGNTNKRKDRVTCFALEIPAPAELPPESVERWYIMVTDFLKRKYKGQNIVSHYLHRDEIHEYYDNGQLRTSRPHIHVFIIPEAKGKLNGKLLSSRANMIKINQEIHEVTRNEFGCNFMTGEDPRRRTVEELKRISEAEMQKKEYELKALERENHLLRQRMNQYEEKIIKLKNTLKKLKDFDEMQKIYHQTFDDEIEREHQKLRSRGITR